MVDADGKIFLSKVADISTFPRYKNIRKVKNLAGVNVPYKAKALGDIGEYDEKLSRREDVDYNWRIGKNGWDIIYNLQNKVKHVYRLTWKSLLYQHYMYGKSYYLVRQKWPQIYSIYPPKINSIFLLLNL